MFSRKSAFRTFVELLFAVALLGGVARSQTTSGTIVGSVTDESGALVPGAKITLVDDTTGDSREVASSDNGDFVFAALRPSSYTLSVEKPGFQIFRQTGLTLNTSERLSLGAIKLTLGQSTQTVTITGEAAAVNTENANTNSQLMLSAVLSTGMP